MKATQKDFEQAARRAVQQCSVFFLCGPDEAGAAAGVTRIVELLEKPGERVEMSGASLRRDPILLGDEARSGSLFGDARHILVRAQGDEALDAVANLLLGSGEACPVIVHATGATDKSRTAKLLEKRPDALVAMFWPPDLKDVVARVRMMAEAAGLKIGGEIAERIARSAGLDIRLAQSEIDKFALYLDASPQAPKPLDGDVLDLLGAKIEEDGFMPLVNAVLSGETRKLGSELARMREQRLNPVAVALAFERRGVQLMQLAAKIGPQRSVHSVVEAEKAARRIFWKDARVFEAQLQHWRGEKLERLLARLTALHRNLMANSQSAELLLAQELTEIARYAVPRR